MNISITKKGKRRGGFYFDIPGKNENYGYPSVTTILRVIAKPQLDTWKIRESIDEYIRTEDRELALLATKKIFHKAGDEGSRAHTLIDEYWKGKEYEIAKEKEVVQKYLLAFEEFKKSNKPKCLESEGVVYSHKTEYAGTYDGLFNIGNEVWLIDWKTSNGIYWEHKIQIIAYKKALEEMGKKVDRCAIVQLKNNGLPVVEMVGDKEKGVDLFKSFLAAKYLFNTKEVIK